MSREEVIAYVKEIMAWARNIDEVYVDNIRVEALEMAIEVLEQTQWILVAERLPEPNGVYLVTEKVFSIDDREHNGGYNTRVEPVEYCNGEWRRARFFDVEAWMPLPEPYKEKK